MTSRTIPFFFLFGYLALLGCIVVVIASKGGYAAGDPLYSDLNPAGFLAGMWHGMILGITFLISLFDPEVGIYESHNNGAWYNFGFLFGLNIKLGLITNRSSDKDEHREHVVRKSRRFV